MNEMKNVTDLLKRAAEEYPKRTAFADTGKSVTFEELYALAQRIATIMLQGTTGVKLRGGDPVAFFMEKSVDSVCAMFGIVMAGGFYSYIDVRQPEERINETVSILKPRMIVTDDENAERLREAVKQQDVTVIYISELMESAGSGDISEELLRDAAEGILGVDPLYVNFTSGSTGKPKGVAVGHRAVIDFISEFVQVFGIDETDVIANQAPFDFDVSVKDVYSGLYTGAEVLLIPREYFTKPSVLMDYLADNEVTTLIWAVSAMCFVSIMNGLEYRVPDKVKRVMFSGEVMPVKHLNKWKSFLPDATYVNLYGPTEITCNCTYYILDREFEKDELIPVGRAFKNEKVFLLDDKDQLVTEKDTEGEICVSGECLALGYYNDREKTDAVFVQNPLNDRYYERIYRTGDLGRYDEDGMLIYTSRKDFQIKHMGQRIELGEIEVSAMSVDGVTRACCLYDEKKKKILLYYTGEADKENVTALLQKKLPQYMMPGRTVRIDEMPMNKNGKIDRARLIRQV